MRSHFCLRLLSRVPINNTSNSISPKPFFSSPFFQPSKNPFFHGQNEVAGRVLQNAFFYSRRFFSNARRRKGPPVNITVEPHASGKFPSTVSRRSFLQQLSSVEGVLIGLIVTNVAVYLLLKLASPEFVMKNFMISVENITNGRLHTLITSEFSHWDIRVLIYKMIGLYYFGLHIGRNFGPQYLLKLYLSGAVAGSIFYLAYHAIIAPLFLRKQMQVIDHARILGMGSNGALDAVIMLDMFQFPNKTIYFNYVIPIPVALIGIFVISLDLLRAFRGDSTVSGAAHIGGLAVAAMAWAQRRRGVRLPRF